MSFTWSNKASSVRTPCGPVELLLSAGDVEGWCCGVWTFSSSATRDTESAKIIGWVCAFPIDKDTTGISSRRVGDVFDIDALSLLAATSDTVTGAIGGPTSSVGEDVGKFDEVTGSVKDATGEDDEILGASDEALGAADEAVSVIGFLDAFPTDNSNNRYSTEFILGGLEVFCSVEDWMVEPLSVCVLAEVSWDSRLFLISIKRLSLSSFFSFSFTSAESWISENAVFCSKIHQTHKQFMLNHFNILNSVRKIGTDYTNYM